MSRQKTHAMIDIDQLSEAQLIDLNHRVVERLRFIQQARAHTRMLEFSIGDRVSFTPDGHGPVLGTLTRYNKKTVSVLADNGQRWNVAPGLLRPVVSASPSPRAPAGKPRLEGGARG